MIVFVCSFIYLSLLHDETTTIPVGIYEKFTSAFSNAVQNLKVGNGFTEGVAQVITLHMLLLNNSGVEDVSLNINSLSMDNF